MWCLETIVALNEKLAQGATLSEAYAECRINVPTREGRIALQNVEQRKKAIVPCGMRKPLLSKAVA